MIVEVAYIKIHRKCCWWVGAMALIFFATVTYASEPAETIDGQAAVEQSPQWYDGRFHNAQPMWGNWNQAMWRIFTHTTDSIPRVPVPVDYSDGKLLARLPSTGLRVTWFGHSSALLEIDGVRLLTDPVWSERVSPFSWIGPRRFFSPPIALDHLPAIDAVLISHDHYDHLDKATILSLDNGHTHFIVPLGVGSRLIKWGIPFDLITELDWWQSTQVGDLTVNATPARHASGRLSPQSDKTLWTGYAMIGPAHRVYYSGDTGLFDALNDIGKRFGPFDITLIEAGQYDADWPDWHLGPEQTVRAHQMVRGKILLPVHWGLFLLAHHTWVEPAERVLAMAKCQGVTVMLPRPGQSVEPEIFIPEEPWWPPTPWTTAAQHPIISTHNGHADDRYRPFVCAPEKTN